MTIASVRERVLQAVQAALGTVSAPAVPGAFTVYRGRREAVPGDKLPALVMRVGSAVPGQLVMAGVEEHRITVVIEAELKAAPGPDADVTLDGMIADTAAAVHRAVMADHTWGDLAVDTNPASEDQDAAPGGTPLGAFVAAYEITFWTKPGDPYALAP